MLLCVLFACREKEVVFTLVESKRIKRSYYPYYPKDFYYYDEHYILIENAPKDKMELKRLMIYCFSHLTSATDTIRTNLKVKLSYCTFLKFTSATKKRFSLTDEEKSRKDTYVGAGERNSHCWFNTETVLGEIAVKRCDGLENKINVSLSMFTGADVKKIKEKQSYAKIYITDYMSDVDTLTYECDTIWYKRDTDGKPANYFTNMK